EEIRNVKFDIIGIAETRLSGSKRVDLPSGYTIYQSGKPQGERTFAGVAFYVPSSLSKRVLGVVFVSDRIIELTLQLRGRRTLRLIQIHVPQAGNPDATYDDFLNELADLLQRFVGPHSASDRNARGDLLHDFCESQKLFAMNSFFRKGRTRRWTWRSPSNQTFNEIDLLLTPDHRYISDVNILAKFDAGSDHRLPPPEFNRLALKLEAAISLLESPCPTPAREYAHLVDTLTHAARAAEQDVQLPRRISATTRALFHRRRQLRFGLANSPHAAIQYAELNKTLRKALTADLHAHHLCILEQAVAANRLRRARSELATGRTQVVHLRRRDGQHTTTTAEAAALVRTFYNDLYRSADGPFVYTPSSSVARAEPLSTSEVF
uniref:Endonuclease/exonuclease/phosphatase domain-containing protein n=1 Tax=Plectus sambesii TaxID=2011161 RepID=A0A914WLJ8_9BILA